MELRAAEWLDIMRREYLTDFVQAGGAAVKVAVAEQDATRASVRDELRRQGEAAGYCVALVDAAETKVHMIDRVFHTVAAQVPWQRLARSFLAQTIVATGRRLPDDPSDLSLTSLARVNDVPALHLHASIGDALWRELYRDYGMSQEFRLAMVRLCRAQLDPDDEPAVTEAVLLWLRGELRRISEVKRALIHQKIVRHNARYLLASLAHWLRRTGYTGLLLILDMTRCPQTAPPRDQRDGSVYYSRAATFDAYEMLRQLIDGTDDVEGMLVIALAGPEFTADPKRSYVQYPALQYRLADEVHDRYRPNPLSALVRIADAS